MDHSETSTTIGCQSCGAALVVEPKDRSIVCPFCTSPSVVERPAAADRPPPLFALGFVLPEREAIKTVTGWIRDRGIFTHSAFKKAPVERMRGIYVPAYLYGGAAHASYEVEIGENYTTTKMTSDGMKTKTETEWRHLAGEYATWVQDVIVTASRGIPNDELENVEPFDLRALKRYSAKMISGWLSEEPSLSTDECFQLARSEAHTELQTAVKKMMPGDKQRKLKTSLRLEREVLELVLLPVWVCAVKYDEEKPAIRILANGQTGKVTGKAPKSVAKIAFAILLGLALIAAVVIGISILGQR